MPEGLKMQTSAATARLRADDGPCYAELKAECAALYASRARELCLVGAVSLAVGLMAWPLAIILIGSVS
jgi:hypothetical protein